MNYIWFDDKTPILNQVKDNFRFAYIIANPLIQMSDAWIKKHRDNTNNFTYATGKEAIEYGKPFHWREMISLSGLEDFKSVALAMKTYISALNKNYARNDLMEIFTSALPEDIYLPNEDKISPFIIPTIIEMFRSWKVIENTSSYERGRDFYGSKQYKNERVYLLINNNKARHENSRSWLRPRV